MARRTAHIPKTALTARKRSGLRASDFAVPSERKYPINDLFHARLALTYVLSPSNAAYRDEVVRAVMARYPELKFWWASRSRRLAAPARRKVANPHDEWMDEDELAREQERKARAALFRRLGPNVGSNADWADPAYALKGGWFLVDSEDGTLDIVKRGRWNERDGFYEDETVARFDTAAEALRLVETLEQKSNPRRRKNPRREVETQAYFAAMEPTRAKYAERSPEELVLVRSHAAKLLRKFAGKSDREVAKALGLDPRDPAVLRQIALMREHPVVTNPRRASLGDETPIVVNFVMTDRQGHKGVGEEPSTLHGHKTYVWPSASRVGQRPRDGVLEVPMTVNGQRYADLRAALPHIEKSLARTHRVVVEYDADGVHHKQHIRTLEGAPRPVANPQRGANPLKRGKAKRSGGRTAAQSNAAKAMRLFHSGKASSLAEAWAMLRR